MLEERKRTNEKVRGIIDFAKKVKGRDSVKRYDEVGTKNAEHFPRQPLRREIDVRGSRTRDDLEATKVSVPRRIRVRLK